MIRRKFRFNKNRKGEWYLILPEWKGDPQDLQMVEGADRWLDLLSNNGDGLHVELGATPFDQAGILTLIRIREENLGGGGNYYLESYQDKPVHLKLWLCEVTRFVFGAIPQKIYFRVL